MSTAGRPLGPSSPHHLSLRCQPARRLDLGAATDSFTFQKHNYRRPLSPSGDAAFQPPPAARWRRNARALRVQAKPQKGLSLATYYGDHDTASYNNHDAKPVA